MKELTTLADLLAALPEDRRREIEAKADAEIQEIREAAGSSQAGLVSRLGRDQSAVPKRGRWKGPA